MKFRLTADAWCKRYRSCEGARDRLKLIGPPTKLAADVLGVTRIRVHQLIKEGKLDSICSRVEGLQRKVRFANPSPKVGSPIFCG